MDKQLIGQIRTLVHKECFNYISGKCVYEHDCTVINPSFSSIHDGAIGCDYFLECVLPIDPELNRIVWAELLRDEEMECPARKDCVWCGQLFLPNSSRQQYCSRCKPLHEKLRNQKKQRDYYKRKQANDA